MIRELRHLLDVLRGRIPFTPPLICLNGHLKEHGTAAEATLLAAKRQIRCRKCFLRMTRVPAPADTDHHIARAAAYYTERGQQP
jgi:hypothetical protein